MYVAYRFITHSAAPWVNHGTGSMTPSRLRSLSPMPKEVTRSISVPQLPKISVSQTESDGMNTIPDPRAATPQPQLSRKPSQDSQHPDLSQEVSMLSTKLINAINHSTMLDDSLQQTRHELETAREQLARLEAKVQEHEDKVSRGLLVEKVVYEKMEKQYGIELKEERDRRSAAEAAKRKTDAEVEALTAALFEEANVVSNIGRGCLTRLTHHRWLQLHAKRLKHPRNAASTLNSKSPTPKYCSTLCKNNCKTSRASWRR
jgi:hypothetical protein